MHIQSSATEVVGLLYQNVLWLGFELGVTPQVLLHIQEKALTSSRHNTVVLLNFQDLSSSFYCV